MPIYVNHKTLDELLQRSDALDEAVMGLLDPETYQTYDASKRISASFAASTVSLEHARGLRLLILAGLPASAISLMRLQYEALTRSVWLLYAAPDGAVEKLQSPLTTAAEKAANRVPSIGKMVYAIDGKAPPSATQMLTQFKDVTADALNSFVHSGIHPLRRQRDGYPLALLSQVVRSSNGLLTMSGMMLANLSGNTNLAKRMGRVQSAFIDCLPDLLTDAQSTTPS